MMNAYKTMSLRRLVVIVGVALIGAVGYGQMPCFAGSRAEALTTDFVISGGRVKMPVGAFLLVRKNGKVGAIRLTKIDPAATEWVGKSTWESFFQPDGSGSLAAKNVIRRTGELDVQDLKGPGRGIYVYQPGVTDALVGKWKFSFGSPTMMSMSDSSFWTGVGDHGYEFAPTSACDLSEIDVNDKKLQWFRFDRNASIKLSIADLPK